MSFSLVPCDPCGLPLHTDLTLPDALVVSCQATADLYRRAGFFPPWIGYVAVADGRAVGGGAFVGPPKEGFVEIAYFTLGNEQGRGFASRTAASLVDIARSHALGIGLKAFTLKEENPSTRILGGLGFSIVGIAQEADAGEVWEWHA